jgi:hypothetical protein
MGILKFYVKGVGIENYTTPLPAVSSKIKYIFFGERGSYLSKSVADYIISKPTAPNAPAISLGITEILAELDSTNLVYWTDEDKALCEKNPGMALYIAPNLEITTFLAYNIVLTAGTLDNAGLYRFNPTTNKAECALSLKGTDSWTLTNIVNYILANFVKDTSTTVELYWTSDRAILGVDEKYRVSVRPDIKSTLNGLTG